MNKSIFAFILVSIMLLLGVITVLADEYLSTIHGSFTGTSAVYTNGNERVGISAVYLSSGAASNKQIRVVNLTGYTNSITASTATLELEYEDAAVCLEAGGKLIFDDANTNTTKWTVFRTNATR